MKVQDIFTRDVRSCGRDNRLNEAAKIMWDDDCGIVPVVDSEGVLAGVITDRDICMAVATRDVRASEIPVGEVMTTQVLACKPEEPVREALKTMREGQVRRLPVVDADGRLVGILALNDVARAAPPPQGPSSTALVQDLMVTLMAVGEHLERKQASGTR